MPEPPNCSTRWRPAPKRPVTPPRQSAAPKPCAHFTVEGVELLEAALGRSRQSPAPNGLMRSPRGSRTGGRLSRGGKSCCWRLRTCWRWQHRPRRTGAECCLLAYGHMVANGVDYERGCQLLAECAAVAQRCQAWRDDVRLINLVILKIKAGQWTDAQLLAQNASDCASPARIPSRRAFAAKLADVARLTGDWTGAREQARRATFSRTARSAVPACRASRARRSRPTVGVGTTWTGSWPGPRRRRWAGGYFPEPRGCLCARLRRAVGDLAGAVAAATRVPPALVGHKRGVLRVSAGRALREHPYGSAPR
jgi:hypothetical protein